VLIRQIRGEFAGISMSAVHFHCDEAHEPFDARTKDHRVNILQDCVRCMDHPSDVMLYNDTRLNNHIILLFRRKTVH